MRDQWLRAGLWILVPFATLLLAAMPLWGPRTMVAVITTWLFVLVLRAVVDPVPIKVGSLRRTAFLAAPFVLMLVDMFRAEDLSTAWKHAERSSALLLFPLGFLLLGAPATRAFRYAMMDIFCSVALALAVYANIGVAFTELPAGFTTEPGSAYHYRAVFGLVSGIHPPYAAYFFFLASLFQIIRYLEGAPYRIVRGIVTLALFLAGLALASRMPLFAFAMTVTLVALFHLPRKEAVRGILAAMLVLGLAVALSPATRQRVMASFHDHLLPTSQKEVTSTNIRLPLARCSMETIADHWLFGTGQAQAQVTLDACYRQFNIPLLLDGSYGTHNQLLHWWLCFGVIGLVLFLVYFGWLVRSAWRSRDVAHLALLVFLLLCMLTENLLARQWGVVLFACFNALFIAGRAEEPVRPRG